MAQVNGHEIKYFFNASDIVLAENDNCIELLFWNEIEASFSISFRFYGLATIGNLVLSFPGFWIGAFIAIAFWFVSKHVFGSNSFAGEYIA
jgi:hypothetical protein